MKFLSNILRRPFSIARSTSMLKNSKTELNFKENNDIADPYDVVDRNISGIEHRLRLYELRRLKQHILLDKSDLNSLKSINLPDEINENESFNCNFELSYSSIALFPGVNCPTESSLDASVTICLKFEYSNFSKLEIDKIKKLLNLDKKSSELKLIISDFPLVSQNKARAIEVVEAIIGAIKNGDDIENGIYDSVQIQDHVFNYKSKLPCHKQNSEFPANWLQRIEAKVNIE